MNTVFSVGPGVFTEDEFSRAVGELDSPDLEGWELLVESMGTKVYRKYREVRGSVIEEPHQHTVIKDTTFYMGHLFLHHR